MTSRVEKIEEALFEKPRRLTTWSGIPLKELYTAQDLGEFNYDRDLADAGSYPFTRGIHRDLYRGKLWTRRQQGGYGSAQDTNRLLKLLIEQGNTGVSIYRDLPTALGIDSDHPMAEGEVGMTGPPLCTLEDMETVLDGIPLDKISVSLLCASCTAPIILAQYIAIAEKRGISPAQLRGTLTNDPVIGHFCYGKEANPVDLAVKVSSDIIEFCARNMPLWNPLYVSAFYNLREAGGLTAPQELAFGLAVALTYIRGALRRGLDIDSILRRASVYVQAGIDIFEEVAKLRALRRMWARLMREELGAKDPRSWQLRIAVQTTGSSLTPQQPLNNIVRIAYQQLVAVLGGAQSVTSSTFDEPICLPTPEAHTSALRTGEILAYETGVPLVADPLGGSYYVEYLTNKVEEEANLILEEIEAMGGFAKAIKSGWAEREMEKGALRYQKEMDNNERSVVGVNVFVTPPEEDMLPGGVLRIPPRTEEEQIARLRRLKANRDPNKVKETLTRLRETAQRGLEQNLIPAILECVKAYATIEEIHGTIRLAYGYTWDPFGKRVSPW